MVSIDSYSISEIVYALIVIYVSIIFLVGARLYEDKVKGRSKKYTFVLGAALTLLSFLASLLPLRIGSVLAIAGLYFGGALYSVGESVLHTRKMSASPVNWNQQQAAYTQQTPTQPLGSQPMQNYQQHPIVQQRPTQQQYAPPQQPVQQPMSWEEMQQRKYGNQNQHQRRQ